MNTITRSLYGATYVPYKPKEEEKGKIRVPFIKAKIIDYVLKNVPKEVASKIFVEVEIPEELRKAISNYLENKDYAKFVSELSGIDAQSIKTFATNFINVTEKN